MAAVRESALLNRKIEPLERGPVRSLDRYGELVHGDGRLWIRRVSLSSRFRP